MKTNTIALVFTAGVALIMGSCSKAPTAPDNGGANLISNPYFVSNGRPSLAGWAINDTGRVKVVSNAPPGATGWSLWLLPPSGGPPAGGVATTYITGESGSGIYNFSCLELNMARWYGGYVLINQSRDGNLISSRGINMEDSVWAMYTLSDTLNLLPSDTISITLMGWSMAVIARGSSDTPVDSATYGCCFNQLSLVKAE
jgi:hypothetical protein